MFNERDSLTSKHKIPLSLHAIKISQSTGNELKTNPEIITLHLFLS